MIQIIKSFYKKGLLLNLLSTLFGQSAYQGEITFNYAGTQGGLFSSIIQDTITSGFCLSNESVDSSIVILASITEQPNDGYDLFLSVLRDTTYPLEPRFWDIPGDGDESNPLSLENLIILIPGLDSISVTQLFANITDTSSTDSSGIALEEIFASLSSNIYFGISGQLEITEASDTSFMGNFNTTMLKPAFYFPPHIISISNGAFNFNKITLPNLKLRQNIPIPRTAMVSQTYPNPFNKNLNIDILIADDLNYITLDLFNLNGEKIENVYNGWLKDGKTRLQWDSKYNPSGIYFLVLKSNDVFQTEKITIVK